MCASSASSWVRSRRVRPGHLRCRLYSVNVTMLNAQLLVQALAMALASLASVGLASAQACNAGVQSFTLPGYKTAAVFADGVISTIDDAAGGGGLWCAGTRPPHLCCRGPYDVLHTSCFQSDLSRPLQETASCSTVLRSTCTHACCVNDHIHLDYLHISPHCTLLPAHMSTGACYNDTCLQQRARNYI